MSGDVQHYGRDEAQQRDRADHAPGPRADPAGDHARDRHDQAEDGDRGEGHGEGVHLLYESGPLALGRRSAGRPPLYGEQPPSAAVVSIARPRATQADP